MEELRVQKSEGKVIADVLKGKGSKSDLSLTCPAS